MRLVLADAPLDWSKVKTAKDLEPFADRDSAMADTVEREVMAKHHHAFLITGEFSEYVHPDIGNDLPAEGDALMHALIAAGGQDPDWLTEAQLTGNPVRIPAGRYKRWYATLPAELRESIEQHWGPPPGELFVDDSGDSGEPEIVLAALRSGNVVLIYEPTLR